MDTMIETLSNMAGTYELRKGVPPTLIVIGSEFLAQLNEEAEEMIHPIPKSGLIGKIYGMEIHEDRDRPFSLSVGVKALVTERKLEHIS